MVGMCGLCNGDFIAVFKQVDSQATDLAGGYNSILNELSLTRTNAEDKLGKGKSVVEVEYRVRVSVETRTSHRLEQGQGGTVKRAEKILTALSEELSRDGLIDSNGFPLIRVGARLDSIENLKGDVVESFPENPGMFVEIIESDPMMGFGISQVAWICSPRRKNT